MIFSLDVFECSACILAQVARHGGASASPRMGFSSGFAQIVMLVLALGIIAVLIRLLLYRSSSSRGKKRLGRLDEKYFADLKRNAATGRVEVPGSRLLFPWALAAGIVGFVVSILVYHHDPGTRQAERIACAFLPLAIIFLISGYLMHLSPRFSRYAKYEVLLSGCLFSVLMAAFQNASKVPSEYLSSGFAYFSYKGLTASQVFWPLAMQIVGFAVFNLLSAWWGRHRMKGISSGDGASRVLPVTGGERGFYRIVMILGPVILGVSVVPNIPIVLVSYLVIRYCLVEAIRRSPILYLRSFRYSDTPTAFGLIVSKVATRYGVVVALAHQSQGPRLFHASTDTTDHAQLQIVPDEAWHEWVLDHLKRCSAVIIDRSVQTDSLLWEIERAGALVDPRKVIIMHDKSIDPPVSPGFQKVAYGLSRKEAKKARKELKSCLQRALG